MHSNRVRVLLAFALAAATGTLACSDALEDKQARCDLRPVDDQCTDVRNFPGVSLVTFQGVCETLKQGKPGVTGYQDDATCPTAGMLGGCQSKSADGSLQTNWYYLGTQYPDEASARAECDSGQTWVGPS